MQATVLQHSVNPVGVYLFEKFLDDIDYLNQLTNLVSEKTEKDFMNKKTNVQGNMTEWNAVLEDFNFNKVHQKILDIVGITYTLRTPHQRDKFNLKFANSWGMRHKKGQGTNNHIHSLGCWSGALYLSVPPNSRMYFHDYDQEVHLQDNLLIVFPGSVQHMAFPNSQDQDRISMAFNIFQEFTYS
jgi:hypothetical protein